MLISQQNLPPGWYDVKAEWQVLFRRASVYAISDGHASELYFYLERTSNSSGSTTTRRLCLLALLVRRVPQMAQL